MKFLDLFAGIGGFSAAIYAVYPQAKCLGYSEIDPYALDIYHRHYPLHPEAGDVRKVDPAIFSAVDLVVGGFPCQDLSIASPTQTGLKGLRSGLFYELLRVLRGIRRNSPRFVFVVENVASMKEADRKVISEALEAEPVMLDAAKVSAQRRQRLFWANMPIPRLPDPADGVGPKLVDVLEPPAKIPRSYHLSAKEIDYMERRVSGGRNHWDFAHHSDTKDTKSACLSANLHRGVPYNVLIDRRERTVVYRKFLPVEVEKLFGFPAGWTETGGRTGKSISNTRRYHALGNAVSVPVVRHILSGLKDKY